MTSLSPSISYRIGPFEVESALLQHAGVAESAVVAIPDAVRGQVVKAFVVLAPSYAEKVSYRAFNYDLRQCILALGFDEEENFLDCGIVSFSRTPMAI